MPVLKANQYAHRPRSAVVMDMARLGREAADYKNDAISQVEAYRAQVEQEAEDRRKTLYAEACAAGYEKGYHTGFEQGQQQARQEVEAGWNEPFEAVHALLNQIAHRLDASVQAVESQLDQQALRFMLAATEALLYRTIEVDRSIVQDQLLQAIGSLGEEHHVLVRINPRDRQAVQAIFPDLLEMLGSHRLVKMAEDPQAPPGGVQVEAGPTRVTANVQTAIARMVEHLLPFSEESEVLKDTEEGS